MRPPCKIRKTIFFFFFFFLEGWRSATEKKKKKERKIDLLSCHFIPSMPFILLCFFYFDCLLWEVRCLFRVMRILLRHSIPIKNCRITLKNIYLQTVTLHFFTAQVETHPKAKMSKRKERTKKKKKSSIRSMDRSKEIST